MQGKIIMIMVIILLSNMSSGDVLLWHHTCNMLKTMTKKKKSKDPLRLSSLYKSYHYNRKKNGDTKSLLPKVDPLGSWYINKYIINLNKAWTGKAIFSPFLGHFRSLSSFIFIIIMMMEFFW